MTREMRQILAELELLSHGKATAWNASGSGKAESREPSGEAFPPHVEFRVRVERGEDVLKEARDYLKAWKKRQAPADTDGSDFEQWVVDDGAGYAVAQVAGKFGISEARVRRIRLRAGRESEFGQPVDGSRPKDNSRERVENLARQGCTLRQIQAQTDVPRETVRRWMKDAA